MVDRRAEPFAKRLDTSRRWLLIYLTAFVVVWTAVPSVVHVGLPLDLTEGYAIGREWVIGYFKHPALPWWLLETTRAITGQVGWPAYLLSSTLVAATIWLAFLLGRDRLGEANAVCGALLLSGVMYFSWVVPEYNHNVAQMPLWLGLVVALWQARERDGVLDWVLVGLLAAAGLYAKIASAVLLVIAGGYVLYDRRLRARLVTRGPWLAVVVFALAVAPLFYWLVQSDFNALDYAAERAQGRRASNVAAFLGKQLASVAGLLVLIGVAVAGRGDVQGDDARPAPDLAHQRDFRAFLFWFLVGPLALVACAAVVMRLGLKGSWGTPMLSVAGPFAVLLTGARLTRVGRLRILAGAFALLIAVPMAYAIAVNRPSGKLLTPQRTSWPQAEIAAELQRIWRDATGEPLRLVAGDLWTGGMVVAFATDRPSLLVEGSLRLSPWIEPARIAREGVLTVWWRTREDPPDYLRLLIGTRIDGKRVFRMRNGDRDETATVYYTIVRPVAAKP